MFQFATFGIAFEEELGRPVETVIRGFGECPGKRLTLGNVESHLDFRVVASHQRNFVGIGNGEIDDLSGHQIQQFGAGGFLVLDPVEFRIFFLEGLELLHMGTVGHHFQMPLGQIGR